ncbi:hypothetical protein [Phocaeicola plebeius]|uniref:hypothetical protein n=1 Tax=Phocaeicola plebeius TaxID=310297 RepID=UPI00266CF514|nr:hypothetical protein [Phocaeicola plebeius]
MDGHLPDLGTQDGRHNPREERKGRREQDGGFRDRGQKPLQDAGNEATDCHTCAKCRHGNTKRRGGGEGRYLCRRSTGGRHGHTPPPDTGRGAGRGVYGQTGVGHSRI